jgi:hypothetical protein
MGISVKYRFHWKNRATRRIPRAMLDAPLPQINANPCP